MVYAYDRTDGLVKIVKRGTKYCIYRLKEVEVDLIHWIPREEKHKFIFETKNTSCYGYKPYDDEDVSNDPDIYYRDVERMHHHKIRMKV